MSIDKKYWLNLLIAAIAALTPIGYFLIKLNTNVSISLERLKSHDGYIEDSEDAREKAMNVLFTINGQLKSIEVKIDNLTSDVTETQDDVNTLKEQQIKRDTDIYKFYQANPQLKNPSIRTELVFKQQ